MESSEKALFDPYKVLNLPEDASQKEVKSRFFSLSRAFHPDKQPAELFQESTQQFEKIEQAYKILSTPMRKYVYDKYGFAGIKVCNDKADKLATLEEDYKATVNRYESIQDSEESDDVQKREIRGDLKLAQESVRENIEYMHRRLEEEHINQSYAKETSINNNIDAEDLVNYYIKKSPHSLQARAAGLKPLIKFGSLSMHHWVLLPEYRGIQHMVGGYANYNNKSYESNYGFKYRFRKILPYFKTTELVGLFKYGDTEREITLNTGKVFDNGLSVTLNNTYANGNFTTSAIVNRRFNDDVTWYTQGQYDGDGELLTGITKEVKNWNMKFDCGLQISSDKIRVSQTATKFFTKKFLAFTTLHTYFTPAPIMQLIMGFTYRISSISKFSFSSSFVGQSFSWELRYTRLGLKLRVPVSLGAKCNSNVLLFSLGVTAALFGSTYLYQKYRKRGAKRLKKLERKHRSRLLDGRRILNTIVAELQNEVHHNIQNEIARDGIVVLKALYGYGPYVKSLYYRELQKSGYRSCFKATESVEASLAEGIGESASLDTSESSEIVDLRSIVQQMVTHSHLTMSLEKLEELKFIYNPCLDDTLQPHLMLKLHMNGKILIVLFQKKSQTIVFSADYDKYVREAQPEAHFNIKSWLSSYIA